MLTEVSLLLQNSVKIVLTNREAPSMVMVANDCPFLAVWIILHEKDPVSCHCYM